MVWYGMVWCKACSRLSGGPVQSRFAELDADFHIKYCCIGRQNHGAGIAMQSRPHSIWLYDYMIETATRKRNWMIYTHIYIHSYIATTLTVTTRLSSCSRIRSCQHHLSRRGVHSPHQTQAPVTTTTIPSSHLKVTQLQLLLHTQQIHTLIHLVHVFKTFTDRTTSFSSVTKLRT